MWLINKFAPNGYDRFIDVFGGSATVTLNRPLKKGCLEIYNDYNSNLTNLFFCVKQRPMALIRELGFLPLNSRDDFNVLYKFFNCEEFTGDYLKEELELTQVYLEPPQAEAIQSLMKERSRLGDVRRAADYFQLVRYSFSGGGKAFGVKSCDIRRFFHLIWECARRLKDVVIENRDFEELLVQCNQKNTFFYCDPPYYEAEGCYIVVFTEADHRRLHDVLLKCQGFVMVSYNDCAFIRELYKEFYIFRTVRPNSMSQKAGAEYAELLITNYDPREFTSQCSIFGSSDDGGGTKYELIHEPIAA